jgi:hypothetical protein
MSEKDTAENTGQLKKLVAEKICNFFEGDFYVLSLRQHRSSFSLANHDEYHHIRDGYESA